jgi:hypothetical protein
MKFGYGLLLVCIVAVAGIATLLFGVDLAHPFGSTNVFVRQAPEPLPEASPQPKTKPVARPATPRVPQTPAAVEPAPAQEVSTLDRTAAGGQIPAAAPKETSAYGDAALSIRRIDRGHDIETLVYAQDRGKKVAVISLKDGKVSSGSPSAVAPATDLPAPRPEEHTTALLARPAEPPPASIAMSPAAEAPKTVPKVLDKTLAEARPATKPPGQPPVQGSVARTAATTAATTAGTNVGTCGEYRDGKLTVKPCSQVPLSTSEWLAKGSSAAPAESAPAANRR